MLASLRLMVCIFKRSARTVLPLMLLIIAAETLLFAGIRVLGSAGSPLSGGILFVLFNYLPQLFYLPAFIVPLGLYLRGVHGSEACFMRSLPVLADSQLSGMMISSLVWSLLAELFRTGLCAYSLALCGGLVGLERQDMMMLVLSPYGAVGYALNMSRNVLAVIFVQLYVAMVMLLAGMSLRRRKLLAVVYGLAGGVLLFFAFAYLAVYDGSSESSAGAAFIRYIPQIICLACFIIVFSIVSAFIMKRRHEVY